MINLKNITKRFKTIIALSDISFDILPGEIVGLIGLNGAGKTTLLRTLSGLYTLDGGEVNFDFDTTVTPRKVALLSSESGLYHTLTTERMINYFGLLQNPDFKVSDIAHIIEHLKIQSVMNKKIEQLSSGWKQKILIILTFMNEPQIILLDEPSNYLDFYGQNQLDELLKTEKSKGKYIVYATHNLHQIETKCDKVVLLHDGKILHQFLPPFENISKSVFDLINR
jgi:sodium transport system ATP-binding protein